MKDFKPLLKYNNKSFIYNIINKLNVVCDKIVVVTGYNRLSIEKEIESIDSSNGIETVFNENYKDGMFSSLQKGLKYLNENDWVMYHFVDQPIVENYIYKSLISEIESEYDWIQPTNSGRKGHPILLSPRITKKILVASSSSNLKQFSDNNKLNKKYIEVESTSIFFDVDTPQDFEKLRSNK